MPPFVIAIDGPAAAGKGTLARRLASHFGFAYLDTGKIYRAVARVMLDTGLDISNSGEAETAARQLVLADLDRPGLRDEATGEAASQIAALPPVRAALLGVQRRMATELPPGVPGIVVDGRDVGTVVVPQAPIKIYLIATAEERARRRHKELLDQGLPSIYCRVLADVIARDERDSQRAVAPLRPAGDALVLDTTELDADAAFAAALVHIQNRIGSALGYCRPK